MKHFLILLILPIVAGSYLCADGEDNFREIIRKAKEKVFPALVFIKPIQEDFTTGVKEQLQVFGSGVVISPDGYVVTNYHVVENVKSIKCVLFDRQQLTARLIGEDPETDIALLKLDIPEGSPPLPFAEFGDSSRLEEGQFVMAMGSPFGFTRSVSFGIISHTCRYLDTGQYNLWIQTDAAINPGNSGGPLVDDSGRVIGINTLGTWAENVAFAIPSNTVQEVVEILKKNGEKGVMRTYTGIAFQALKDYSRETILEANEGVLVAHVEPGSPADKAGIVSGDIILKCDDRPVNGVYLEELPAVRSFFATIPSDSIVSITLCRNGAVMVVPMELKPQAALKGDIFECTRWDMTIAEINKFKDPNAAFFREKGVYVVGVSYGNAYFSGFVSGDVIERIGDREIVSLETAQAVYEESLTKPDDQKKLLCQVLRNGMPYYLLLDYRRDFKKLKED